jgi:hypothetical protein
LAACDGRKINPDARHKAEDARRRSKVAESEWLEIGATSLMAWQASDGSPKSERASNASRFHFLANNQPNFVPSTTFT